MEIIELLTPAYEAAWLPWAVQYFFLIGIAATSALLAAWLAFGASGSDRARQRTSRTPSPPQLRRARSRG